MKNIYLSNLLEEPSTDIALYNGISSVEYDEIAYGELSNINDEDWICTLKKDVSQGSGMSNIDANNYYVEKVEKNETSKATLQVDSFRINTIERNSEKYLEGMNIAIRISIDKLLIMSQLIIEVYLNGHYIVVSSLDDILAAQAAEQQVQKSSSDKDIDPLTTREQDSLVEDVQPLQNYYTITCLSPNEILIAYQLNLLPPLEETLADNIIVKFRVGYNQMDVQKGASKSVGNLNDNGEILSLEKDNALIYFNNGIHYDSITNEENLYKILNKIRIYEDPIVDGGYYVQSTYDLDEEISVQFNNSARRPYYFTIKKGACRSETQAIGKGKYEFNCVSVIDNSKSKSSTNKYVFEERHLSGTQKNIKPQIEVMGEELIDKYRRGRQSVSVSVGINNNEDIYHVGDRVFLLKMRKNDFLDSMGDYQLVCEKNAVNKECYGSVEEGVNICDKCSLDNLLDMETNGEELSDYQKTVLAKLHKIVNDNSYMIDIHGRARRFIVTNAELKYNGAYTQKIDLLEEK